MTGPKNSLSIPVYCFVAVQHMIWYKWRPRSLSRPPMVHQAVLKTIGIAALSQAAVGSLYFMRVQAQDPDAPSPTLAGLSPPCTSKIRQLIDMLSTLQLLTCSRL